MSHVLVTGGAGYIGSQLVEHLLRDGHRVTVLDRMWFGNTLADLAPHESLTMVEEDIRRVTPANFEGVDAVCDLASLSNDPAGDLDATLTMDINFRGRARVCHAAREAGAKQYILASSCSIYGFQDDTVDETSPINPLTTYAEANRRAEEATLALSTTDFTVTALRQATVYGPSRRMRFDLAINGMTRSLHREGRIKVMRDGTQWRPMVHVDDTCRAFLAVLEADRTSVNGQIINVGSDDQNVQIGPLARDIAAAANVSPEPDWYGDPDTRSYRVDFSKAARVLGFEPRYRPVEGALQVLDGLRAEKIDDGPSTITVSWYQKIGMPDPA